jgi:hypothetical protein
MDVVRAAAESIAAPPPGGAKSRTAAPPMSLTDFTGESPFPECGPLNIFRTGAQCGWRVKKSGAAGIRLALDFTDPRTSLTGVTLTFAEGLAPRGVSVATRVDGQPADAWSADRYCRLTSGRVLTCALGERIAAGLRLTFDAEVIELLTVSVR